MAAVSECPCRPAPPLHTLAPTCPSARMRSTESPQRIMPLRTHASKASLATPKEGITSSRAFSKSSQHTCGGRGGVRTRRELPAPGSAASPTLVLSSFSRSSSAMFEGLMHRFVAKETALLHRPSISAAVDSQAGEEPAGERARPALLYAGPHACTLLNTADMTPRLHSPQHGGHDPTPALSSTRRTGAER